MRNIIRLKVRQLLVTSFMIGTITVLTIPGRSATTRGFCDTCENDCYTNSETVKEYNLCVMMCNYAGCNIPYIE